MNFRVIDGTYLDYESAKKDYINGIRGEELQAKHGISTNKYKKFLRELRADGVETVKKGSYNRKKPAKHYTRVINKGYEYFVVKRYVKKQYYYGGCFKTENGAKRRVKELDEIGWESCL